MKKMFTNLIGWLIIFGISGALANMFGIDQFQMYFRISIGLLIVLCAILLICFVSLAVASQNSFVTAMTGVAATQVLVSFLVATVVTLIVAVVFANTFSMNFYMVYAIMSLGRCTELGSSKTKKKKNKDK